MLRLVAVRELIMGMHRARNLPCPCGSGRKYKKCCLPRHQELQLDHELPDNLAPLDLISIQHGFILAEHEDEIMSHADDYVDLLDQRLFAVASKVGLRAPERNEFLLGPDVATKALIDRLNEIEEQISVLASRHSKLYWLQASRRLFPAPTGEMTSWTRNLCWLTFMLSLYKYGNSDIDDMQYNKNFSSDGHEIAGACFGPTSITYEDILTLYQIENLAVAYYETTSILRRIWKGGRLSIDDNLEYETKASPEVEQLIEILDERFSKYSTASQITYFKPDLKVALENPFAVMFLPLINDKDLNGYILNKDRSITEIEDFKPNYFLLPIPHFGLYKLLLPFDEMFKSQTGYSFSEIFSFACALCTMDMFRSAGVLHKQYQMVQRAYRCYDKADLVPMLLPYFKTTYKEITGQEFEGGEERLRGILEFLKQDVSEYSEIDLWCRRGFKPIHLFGDAIYVDYLLLVFFIVGSLPMILARMDGDTGSLKGEQFENCVADIVRDQVGVEPMFVGKILKRADDEFEVDIGFVKDAVLFLGECRARNRNTGIEKGVPEVLATRWQLTIDDLAEIDCKAIKLASNPVGANYKLPNEVTCVVPFVCYPNVEYVPELRQEYWLDDVTPRACTPEEICLIANTKAHEVSTKLFSVTVTRGTP